MFHTMFMSDLVWTRLDVHDVRHNIAAHYLYRKHRMSLFELAFCGAFDYHKWAHPSISRQQFSNLTIYTQAHVLAESNQPVAKNHLWKFVGNPDVLAYAARTANGLWFATDECRRDAAFMLQFIGSGGNIVYHCSDHQRIIASLQCTLSDHHVLRDCSTRLKGDKAIVLAHFARHIHHFQHVPENLRDDFDVAMAAIAKAPLNLRLCSLHLRNNKDVVTAAVKRDGAALRWASDDLKRDFEVVATAVRSNAEAIQCSLN